MGHRAALWTASMSPQHEAVLPWALGEGTPGDSARTRLHGGTRLGKGDAAPDLINMPPGRPACWQGGREGVGAHTSGTEEPSAPGAARGALRALSFTGSAVTAYLAPGCQAQPLPAYRGDSWALRINSVPANYALNGKQILNG